MLDHQPETDLDLELPEQTVTVPRRSPQARRRASLATNRPERNSRPLAWKYYGALTMPYSEHLIPFLN